MPARNARPKDRRETIEAVATELFATQGFTGTRLAEIADRVGVSSTALYRHFAGKDALLASIIVNTLTRFGDAVDAAAQAPGLDARARLEQVLGAMVDIGHSTPDAVTVYVLERQRLQGGAQRERHTAEARLATTIGGLMREVHPGLSELEVTVRLRAMDGGLASAAIGPHPLPLERRRALFVDGLVAVLLAPPDERAQLASTASRGWSPPSTRRTEILDAAANLFRLYGYQGAAVDQIADAAGIAGPTVYGTYASKADILVDAIEVAVATVGVLTDQALSRANSPGEAISLLSASYAESVLANLDIIAVAARDLRHLPAEDGVRIRRWQGDYRQRAERVLLELRPELTEAEARTVFAGAYALVGDVALGHQKPSAEWIAVLMETFLRAAPPRQHVPILP